MLLSTIWTFNDFAIVYILTKGGPGGATMVLPVLTYEIAFGAQRLGEAIAVALYMLPAARLRDHRAVALHAAGAATRDEQSRRRSQRGSRSSGAVRGVLRDPAHVAAVRALPVLLDDRHVVQGRDPDAQPGLDVLAEPVRRPRTTSTCSARPSSSRWYSNSVIVSVSSTFLATAIGTIGAYALARLKFLGRAFMASAVLITYLVPPSILFIPLYAQIRNLGPGRQPRRPDRGLPVLHGAVRDLAADGLLRVDPGGARRSRR